MNFNVISLYDESFYIKKLFSDCVLEDFLFKFFKTRQMIKFCTLDKKADSKEEENKNNFIFLAHCICL